MTNPTAPDALADEMLEAARNNPLAYAYTNRQIAAALRSPENGAAGDTNLALFIEAIHRETPNGEYIAVKHHPNGDWSVSPELRARPTPEATAAMAVREALQSIVDHSRVGSGKGVPRWSNRVNYPSPLLFAARAALQLPADQKGGSMIFIQQTCPPHQWAFAPTVGYYDCMKCHEKRYHDHPRYAEAAKEYAQLPADQPGAQGEV